MPSANPNPNQPGREGRGGQGGRGPNPYGGYGRAREPQETEGGLKETVVVINRVSKTVKGGKRFSFSALVVVGDGAGKVGYGLGKAKEVQAAIKKGSHAARKSMVSFPVVNDSIPHEAIGRYGAGQIWMKPAAPGTGVLAGGGARAILEAGGIKNILTKSLGSHNPFNVVGATVDALLQMRTKDDVLKLRGKTAAPKAAAPAGNGATPVAA